jgi:hypothetical protein
VVGARGDDVHAGSEAPAAAQRRSLCLSGRDERVGSPREFRTQAIGVKYRPARPAVLATKRTDCGFEYLGSALRQATCQRHSLHVVGAVVHQYAAHDPAHPRVRTARLKAGNLVGPTAQIDRMKHVPGLAGKERMQLRNLGHHLNPVATLGQSCRGLLELHGVTSGLRPKAFAGEKKQLHGLNVLRPRRTFGGNNELPAAMAIPKFLVGDNTDHPDSVFLIHTEFPRFVMDLDTDEIEWLDDVDGEDEADLTDEMAKLLGEAQAFYQREVDRYEDLED